MTKYVPSIIAVIALILLGLLGGWYIYRPAPPKPETYAPAVRQADGSRVLERKPEAAADIKPKHMIPKGGKVERVEEVVIKPTAPEAKDCPPVKVDMSVVKMPDDSRRVIASSPDGTVLSGVDVPVEPPKTVKDLKWAAGVTFNPWDRTLGGFVDRDLGPFRVGIEVNQRKGGIEAITKIGFRF